MSTRLWSAPFIPPNGFIFVNGKEVYKETHRALHRQVVERMNRAYKDNIVLGGYLPYSYLPKYWVSPERMMRKVLNLYLIVASRIHPSLPGWCTLRRICYTRDQNTKVFLNIHHYFLSLPSDSLKYLYIRDSRTKPPIVLWNRTKDLNHGIESRAHTNQINQRKQSICSTFPILWITILKSVRRCRIWDGTWHISP